MMSILFNLSLPLLLCVFLYDFSSALLSNMLKVGTEYPSPVFTDESVLSVNLNLSTEPGSQSVN